MVNKKLFNGIYKDKTVLITGHTGFKGSWLALWLQKMGAHVLGYSLKPPTQPNHFDLLHLEMASIIGDIRHGEHVEQTIQKYKPDIVFHLAAQPIVRLSYKYPIETLQTNIIGVANIFEACRNEPSVNVIINVTSDKCYENKELPGGYKENDPMGGYDPYSVSKGCSELITSSYRNSFFNHRDYGKTHNTLIASARAGNVIGGGDWAEDRLIPDIIKAAHQNKKTIIRNPHAVRPWQHVLESLAGYLHLGWKLLENKKEFASSWNFGPSEERVDSVKDIIERMKKYWDIIDYEIQSDQQNLHETNYLKLDCSKAFEMLQQKNVWDTNKTIEKTVLWYKNYYTTGRVTSEENLISYIDDAKKSSVNWAV